MDQAQGRFARLLPPEEGASRRTMLLSFGLWPVAMLLTLRGQGLGLGSLGLVAIPLSVTAFKRLRDRFPPGPARRVITGYSGLYMLLVGWMLLAHFGSFGLLGSVVAAAASIHVLTRRDEDGHSVVESMIARAVLLAGPRTSEDDDPGDARIAGTGSV
ncbi:MAG: hypothetical protein ACTJGR_07610 [Pauljensenia sp.]